MRESKYLIKKTPLLKKVHDIYNGIRFKEEAIEVFQDQIDFIIEMICSLAVDSVHRNNRKTIMTDDIYNAFDEFMQNKNEINNIIEILKKCLKELNEVEKNSINKRFFGDV